MSVTGSPGVVALYLPGGGEPGQSLVKTGVGAGSYAWGYPGSGVGEINPAFTYTSGLVTRIDYDSGNYKLFTYTSGVLTRIDYVRPGSATIRKTFNYTGDVLSSITQTEV